MVICALGSDIAVEAGFFYGASLAHTMTGGLVAAPLWHRNCFSLTIGSPTPPQTQTPDHKHLFWSHSSLHAAAVEFETHNSNRVLGNA
jgi:hypothetical protein